MKKLTLLILFTGFLAGISYSQSPWLNETRLSSITFEWDKPMFDNRTFDNDDVTAATSVLFITGRFRVSDDFRLVAELPISHFGYDGNNPFGGDDNSTNIGNIYAGFISDINLSDPYQHAFVELGVRIPTAPSPNTNDKFGINTGLFSEVDRREAFTTDSWAIPLIFNYVTSVSDPFALKFRLGTIYDIYVDDLENLDNEFHLLYGATTMYRIPTFEAYAGFLGRNRYIGNDPDFFDDGFTQVRAGIARPFGNITPGIYARLPLGDNYNQFINFAYGVTLEIRGR